MGAPPDAPRGCPHPNFFLRQPAGELNGARPRDRGQHAALSKHIALLGTSKAAPHGSELPARCLGLQDPEGTAPSTLALSGW